MSKHTWICLAAALTLAPALAQETPTLNVKSEGKRDALGMSALTKDRPKDAQTEITARNHATFDNETNVAEFEGSVVVRDPQFTLTCDKLRVFLRPDRKGMQKVEAIGNVLIKQENVTERGEKATSTGQAGKAIYTPEDGNVVLTEWPQIERGINVHIATEKGTVMTLNRDGRMNTQGGSKTLIKDTSQTP
ncbi:MAG TPA: LptA/OstA family protein [Chthoniobacterales bacterium]